MRSSYTTQDNRGVNMYIQFCCHKISFAATKLVLLPGLQLGSKSLLPPTKNEFVGCIYITFEKVQYNYYYAKIDIYRLTAYYNLLLLITITHTSDYVYIVIFLKYLVILCRRVASDSWRHPWQLLSIPLYLWRIVSWC